MHVNHLSKNKNEKREKKIAFESCLEIATQIGARARSRGINKCINYALLDLDYIAVF